MAVYFADRSGAETFAGSIAQCAAWARARVAADPAAAVQILRARAGEPSARIVAEVTRGGVRLIARGRRAPVAALTRKLRRGSGPA